MTTVPLGTLILSTNGILKVKIGVSVYMFTIIVATGIQITVGSLSWLAEKRVKMILTCIYEMKCCFRQTSERRVPMYRRLVQ